MKKNMKKRGLSLLLLLALVLALAAPAFAVAYSDVPEGYWGKPYIDELSERGLFSGYEDGTFRPNGKITFCETLVLLSRLFPVDEQMRGYIDADYAEFVTETVPSNLSWANKELCVCLAAGIISETEMSRVNLAAQINKQTLGLLLVRALGLRDRIKDYMDFQLSFTDADKLISDYRGSIAILYAIGVVTGDENNAFNPAESVSRVVAATMLSRALSYADSAGLELRIRAYEGYDSVGGILRAIENGVMLIELNNGLFRELPYTDDTAFTLNKAAVKPENVKPGAYARVSATEGVATAAALTAAEGSRYVSGELVSVNTMGDGSLSLRERDSGLTTHYGMVKGAFIMRNEQECKLDALKPGDHLILNLKDGLITEAAASLISDTIKGRILSLSVGSVVELRLADENGRAWYFPLDVAQLPEILQGELPLTIDQLKPDDAIKLVIENSSVKKILAEGTEEKLVGTVSAVTESLSGLFWEITDELGAVRRLSVAENATAYKDKERILLSAVKVGDRVTLSLFNSVVTAATVESSAVTADQLEKVTGTLLNADESKRQLILLVNGKLCYVDAPAGTPIYYAEGRALGMSAITNDSVLLVYGRYNSAARLQATLVIVEQAAAK